MKLLYPYGGLGSRWFTVSRTAWTIWTPWAVWTSNTYCRAVWRFGWGFGEPRSQSDPRKDRDWTEDTKVVSGSHQAKNL